MKTSKANMLLMLEIRRDLRKLALEHKIDAFYIKTISIKVFTKEDYSRYIREEADFEEKHPATWARERPRRVAMFELVSQNKMVFFLDFFFSIISFRITGL